MEDEMGPGVITDGIDIGTITDGIKTKLRLDL